MRASTVLRSRSAIVAVTSLLVLALAPAASASGGGPAAGDAAETIETRQMWTWPVPAPHRLDRPFIAPAHAYGPGHRGVDILPLGAREVLAPADGVVAFAGSVAGRGVLTIDHGDGLVSSYEPVASDLAAGTPVTRGERVADLTVGGHAAAGRLHFGVRLDGEYVNPLLLLGGVPRAVLLPCC